MTTRRTFLATWATLRDVNTRALEHPNITMGELRILTVLATHMAYYCRSEDWFTHRRLADLAHVGINTVPRALAKLEKKGLIEYERGRYRGAASVFRFIESDLSIAPHELGDLLDEKAPQHDRESPPTDDTKPPNPNRKPPTAMGTPRGVTPREKPRGAPEGPDYDEADDLDDDCDVHECTGYWHFNVDGDPTRCPLSL